MMMYHTLNDGMKIPYIGLGTYQQPHPSLMDVLSSAVENGYRLFDTASIYKNQKIIGQFIKNSPIGRSELFITSKIWNNDHENVVSSVKKSMDELQTDYLDLCLIHWPATKDGNFIRAWESLIMLRKKKLIRSIGVSNFTAQQVNFLFEVTGILPAVNQIEVHLRNQQQKIIREMSDIGIFVQSWSPLWTSFMMKNEYLRLTDMALKYNKSMAQIILRWHIDSGLGVIPKTSKLYRLRENMSIFDIELSPNDLIFLSSLNQDNKIMEYPDDYI
ncbi:aldo/keto reductase [Xenorhabdus littoralis]|uniref:aldo/keto reductase n=1 Tax=Xenorhabdus littoralis TaxID=2582835 RepID=UPI0029E800CF|nr:aldo/keto reductase [Xenorhabdus sp. psl]MDX7991760.1 aldo/keto reductase [Xenorhabdus sp. psl]